eukprot:3380794-Pyramimonas_sp.AAC.1
MQRCGWHSGGAAAPGHARKKDEAHVAPIGVLLERVAAPRGGIRARLAPLLERSGTSLGRPWGHSEALTARREPATGAVIVVHK